MQDADDLFNLVSSKGRGLYYKNEKVDNALRRGPKHHGSDQPAYIATR